MIVLTAGDGKAGAPAAALRMAEELPEGGMVLVLEQGDNVEKIRQAGRYGLLTHLDDPWQPAFESVQAVREDGGRLFVARLAYGRRPMAIVAPDAEWLDDRLRLVLDVEAIEVSPGG